MIPRVLVDTYCWPFSSTAKAAAPSFCPRAGAGLEDRVIGGVSCLRANSALLAHTPRHGLPSESSPSTSIDAGFGLAHGRRIGVLSAVATRDSLIAPIRRPANYNLVVSSVANGPVPRPNIAPNGLSPNGPGGERTLNSTVQRTSQPTPRRVTVRQAEGSQCGTLKEQLGAWSTHR